MPLWRSLGESIIPITGEIMKYKSEQASWSHGMMPTLYGHEELCHINTCYRQTKIMKVSHFLAMSRSAGELLDKSYPALSSESPSTWNWTVKGFITLKLGMGRYSILLILATPIFASPGGIICQVVDCKKTFKFLSPPVLMHGGLLRVAFCLYVTIPKECRAHLTHKCPWSFLVYNNHL